MIRNIHVHPDAGFSTKESFWVGRFFILWPSNIIAYSISFIQIHESIDELNRFYSKREYIKKWWKLLENILLRLGCVRKVSEGNALLNKNDVKMNIANLSTFWTRDVHGGAAAAATAAAPRPPWRWRHGRGRFLKKSSRQRRGSSSIFFREHWKTAWIW